MEEILKNMAKIKAIREEEKRKEEEERKRKE